MILLGEIIHNPWVNDHFRRQGVEILSREQRVRLDEHVRAVDCAIIPAFGVPLPIERRLGDIGSRTIDCTCGDVRRLWRWSEQAARDGFGVVVFGRSRHDETVVTKSRLADVGGAYLMLENLDQVRTFTEQLRRRASEEEFRRAYDADATNAACLAPFDRLAQVSQTTMLYRDTQQVREILHSAIVDRFGPETDDRLRFQPTVCRATQDRQDAAVELCRSGCDLVIVVGGFESSNTRHLHELAGQYAPAYLIENAPAIRSAGELLAYDRAAQSARLESGWLPARRRLRIGVLAGASSPEIVIGQVLERLAEFLT